MRMTELRCPACGGDLKIDKNNPNTAVCDYCNTQFFLEKETGFLNPEGKYVAKEIPKSGSGRKADGQKRLAAGGLLGTALLVLVCGMRIYLRWERVNERARDAMRQQSAKNWEIQERNLNSALEEQLTDRMPGVYVEGYGAESGEQPLTGAFGETAERIFEKPADEITEKELAQIKWLETERDMDYLYVGYSLADPYGEDGAELTWLTFPDDTDAGVSCLFRFTGLRKVDLYQHIGAEDIRGLDLAGIGGYFGSLPDLTGLVNLEELTCSAFMQPGQPLGFVADFPALKKVDVSGMSTYDDISGIFNIRGLVCLDISGVGCEIDFDRIGDNPSLEVLRMDGIRLYENVRTGGSDGFYWADWDDVVLDGHTDFLKHFPGLKELGMAENELTDLGFASNLPQLESLDIAGNYVTDLRPLAGIAPLRLVDCTDNPISNERVLGDGVVIVTDGGTETGF